VEIQDKENDRRRRDDSGDESLSGLFVHGPASLDYHPAPVRIQDQRV
jgi:hypothetical protein